jgi:hypothetical protein
MSGWTAYKRENIEVLVRQRDHLGYLVESLRAAASRTPLLIADAPPILDYPSHLARFVLLVALLAAWLGRNRSGKGRRRGTGRGEIRGAHRQIHLSHRSPSLSKARP